MRATVTWGLLVFAALSPIGLLGLVSFRVTSHAVREMVHANNQAAARITAELVGHDLEASMNFARAFAALPGMAEAVARRDEEEVRARLRALVESSDRVDRAFVADPEGLLWSDYPPAPEALGRNFSHRDWFRGVSRARAPYVSRVYRRQAEPRPMVVAIAVPILGERRMVGELVYQYRLDGITEWLRKIRVGGSGYAFVVDQAGVLAAHPKLDLQARLYGDYAPLIPTMPGGPTAAEYVDPLAREPMIASFEPVPIGDHRWMAVAQQPIAEAYAPIRRLGRHIGAAAGILGLAALAIVTTLGRVSERNRRLYQQLEERSRDLQASERRYRQLTEGSLDPIVVADQHGVITLFNPAAQAVFGYSEREILGQPLTVLMPPEYRDAHRMGLQRYLSTRQPRIVGRTVELRGQRKDGTIFPLELSLSVLELPESIVLLGSIRDITERHRMQARVTQVEKLASLGLLSAGMAHEINNPLAYVANNLAVVEREARGLLRLAEARGDSRPGPGSAHPDAEAPGDQPADEIDLAYLKDNLPAILASTRQGVKRVADIVQNLRNFARLDRADLDRVDLHESINCSLEMIRSRLGRRGIAVEQQPGDLPLVACAPAQLNQVFLNLLVNAMQAIEATSRGTGRIRIRTWRAGDEVVVEIGDDGRGIPPEVLPRIFDPFFTTKAVGEGTGLGLSISHGIVEDHGGRIEVESTPGLGSRFRVILPIGGKGPR